MTIWCYCGKRPMKHVLMDDCINDQSRITWKGTPMSEPHLTNILAERGKRYGDFTQNAQLSQALKRLCEKADFGKAVDLPHLTSVQQEALCVILQKISRIVTGNPDYVDNWDDIAGYATLVADRLERDNNEAPTETTK